MSGSITVRALALAPILAATLSAPAGAVIDARGLDVRLPAPAQRIVTLAPSLAELVDGAGAGPRLVGVSSATDLPAWAAHLPVVAAPGRVDMERLVSLQPDLVIAWLSGNPRRALERIEQRGIAVFATEPHRLADIARAVRAIGVLAGTQPAAEATADRFESTLATLPRARGHPRVFIEIWDTPLTTVSGDHLMSDVVRRCGGDNVFDKLPAIAAPISVEQLYAADPEFILASGEGTHGEAAWRRYPLLTAVRTGRVASVDPNLFARMGLGVGEAARAVCGALVAAFGRQ